MRWPYPNIGVLTTRAFRNLLNKIFGDIGSDMQEQKSRVDNLIQNSPQPSEVQDIRTAQDGTVYPTARDRINADYTKTNQKVDENQAATAAQLADTAKMKVLNIIDYGAKVDGTTNDWQAFVDARTASWGAGSEPFGRVHFPKGITYFAHARQKLINCYISADPEAVIKMEDVDPDIKYWRLLTPIRVQNLTHGTTRVFPANVHVDMILPNIGSAVHDIINDEKPSLIDFTTWQNKIWNEATGDTTATGTATITADTVSWSNTFTQNPQFLKPPTLNDGACYECNILATDTNAVAGFILKTSDNHLITVTVDFENTTWIYREYNATGSILLEKSYTAPNGGAFGLLLNEDQNLGFYYKNAQRASFMIAGLTVFSYSGKFGSISEMGFFVDNTSASSSVVFKDGIMTLNYKYRSQIPLKLALLGDSISFGAWTSLSPDVILPAMLQNINGIGKVTLDNYSISGRSSQSWVADIDTYDLTGYDYVLVMLGTNDLQDNIPVSTYLANMETIANKIIADGSTPLFMVFPVFTSKTITGTGVETSNYAYHAKYTQGLKIWCIQNGYEYGDARRNMGANLDWLGDNIHPTDEGQIAMCKSWAELLYRVLSK